MLWCDAGVLAWGGVGTLSVSHDLVAKFVLTYVRPAKPTDPFLDTSVFYMFRSVSNDGIATPWVRLPVGENLATVHAMGGVWLRHSRQLTGSQGQFIPRKYNMQSAPY